MQASFKEANGPHVQLMQPQSLKQATTASTVRPPTLSSFVDPKMSFQQQTVKNLSVAGASPQPKWNPSVQEMAKQQRHQYYVDVSDILEILSHTLMHIRMCPINMTDY
jgi:hypothetical protein